MVLLDLPLCKNFLFIFCFIENPSLIPFGNKTSEAVETPFQDISTSIFYKGKSLSLIFAVITSNINTF